MPKFFKLLLALMLGAATTSHAAPNEFDKLDRLLYQATTEGNNAAETAQKLDQIREHLARPWNRKLRGRALNILRQYVAAATEIDRTVGQRVTIAGFLLSEFRSVTRDLDAYLVKYVEYRLLHDEFADSPRRPRTGNYYGLRYFTGRSEFYLKTIAALIAVVERCDLSSEWRVQGALDILSFATEMLFPRYRSQRDSRDTFQINLLKRVIRREISRIADLRLNLRRLAYIEHQMDLVDEATAVAARDVHKPGRDNCGF